MTRDEAIAYGKQWDEALMSRGDSEYSDARMFLLKAIRSLQEHKTGKWQERIGFYICTNCHTHTPSACIHYLCGLPNYCPHCGAEMGVDNAE